MSDSIPDNFAVNEPVLWHWVAKDRHGRSAPIRRRLLTWWQIAVVMAVSGAIIWRDFGTAYCVDNRCRLSLISVIFFGVALVLALMKLSGLGNRQLDRMMMSLFPDRRFAAFRGYVLTPTRLLRLDWDGSIESFQILGGDVVLQYGRLRIDLPDARGKTLISHIPPEVQQSLFAAIKSARGTRVGKAELTA